MENGGIVPYEEIDFKKILSKWRCPCCMEVLMPTEEELEQRINEHIDRERVKEAILSLEIEQMNKALDKTKAVMGE